MTADFAERVAALDIALFDETSETSQGDKRTLLMLQNVTRTFDRHYTYLEVGSYLGGTLLPHLLDPHCGEVISIDPRPASQPDERGRSFDYNDNSTSRMIDSLSRSVPPGLMAKLRTYDIDAAQLTETGDDFRARLALIDGEHTIRAAFRDFCNVLPHMHPDSMVAFHDSWIVVDALACVESMLRYAGTTFCPLYLPDAVYAVALGRMAVVAKHAMRRMAFDESTFVADARKALHRHIIDNANVK